MSPSAYCSPLALLKQVSQLGQGSLRYGSCLSCPNGSFWGHTDMVSKMGQGQEHQHPMNLEARSSLLPAKVLWIALGGSPSSWEPQQPGLTGAILRSPEQDHLLPASPQSTLSLTTLPSRKVLWEFQPHHRLSDLHAQVRAWDIGRD
jgi:hypothetical protein